MIIYLLRHGAKNNSSEEHKTGVEALLDPSKINDIVSLASDFKNENKIKVFSSSVPRCKATAEIFCREINCDFVIDNTLSSYELNDDGEVINLSPKKMSRIWGEAKELDKTNREEAPLRAWFTQGFDNVQSLDQKDPGFSLREIGFRLGYFINQKIEELSDKVIVCFSHSGDIETWLALTLAMNESNNKKLIDYFFGALYPLQGLQLSISDNFIQIDSPLLENSVQVDRKMLQIQSKKYLAIKNKVKNLIR